MLDNRTVPGVYCIVLYDVMDRNKILLSLHLSVGSICTTTVLPVLVLHASCCLCCCLFGPIPNSTCTNRNETVFGF